METIKNSARRRVDILRIYVLGTVFVGFGLQLASCERNVMVTMYTDLIHFIGKKNTCEPVLPSTGNETTELESEQTSLPKQGVLLSKHTFRKIDKLSASIGKCDVINIASQTLAHNNWTCFKIGNKTTMDFNWFFVNCNSKIILSIQCLSTSSLLVIKDSLCGKEQEMMSCQEFQMTSYSSTVWCSKNFKIEKSFHQVISKSVTFTSPYDIAAYLCASFIMVTFFLSVCIPAEKCKPNYKCDKEAPPRIPMQVYEMCGTNYKPTERKRRNLFPEEKPPLPTILTQTRKMAAVKNTSGDGESQSKSSAAGLQTPKSSISSNGAENSPVSPDTDVEREMDSRSQHVRFDLGENTERERKDSILTAESDTHLNHPDVVPEFDSVVDIPTEVNLSDSFMKLPQPSNVQSSEAMNTPHHLSVHQTSNIMKSPNIPPSLNTQQPPSTPQSLHRQIADNILSSNLSLDKVVTEHNAEKFMCNPQKFLEDTPGNVSGVFGGFPKTNKIGSVANRTTFDVRSTPLIKRAEPVRCKCMSHKRHSLDMAALKFPEIMENFRKGDFLDCSTMAFRPGRLTKFASLNVYIESNIEHNNLLGDIHNALTSSLQPEHLSSSFQHQSGINTQTNSNLDAAESVWISERKLGRSLSARCQTTPDISQRQSNQLASCSHCGHFSNLCNFNNSERRYSTTTQSSNSEYPSRRSTLEKDVVSNIMEKKKSRKFSIC